MPAMSDEFLNSFDPKDIEDLQARADKIESDADTFYEIKLMIPHSGAEAFISTYVNATDGNIMAMLELMSFVTTVVEVLQQRME
jgi:hypothetical protein